MPNLGANTGHVAGEGVKIVCRHVQSLRHYLKEQNKPCSLFFERIWRYESPLSHLLFPCEDLGPLFPPNAIVMGKWACVDTCARWGNSRLGDSIPIYVYCRALSS